MGHKDTDIKQGPQRHRDQTWATETLIPDIHHKGTGIKHRSQRQRPQRHCPHMCSAVGGRRYRSDYYSYVRGCVLCAYAYEGTNEYISDFVIWSLFSFKERFLAIVLYLIAICCYFDNHALSLILPVWKTSNIIKTERQALSIVLCTPFKYYVGKVPPGQR